MNSILPILFLVVSVVIVILVLTENMLFERLRGTLLPLWGWGVVFFLGAVVTLVFFAPHLDSSPFVDAIFLLILVVFLMVGGSILKAENKKWIYKKFLKNDKDNEENQ